MLKIIFWETSQMQVVHCVRSTVPFSHRVVVEASSPQLSICSSLGSRYNDRDDQEVVDVGSSCKNLPFFQPVSLFSQVLWGCHQTKTTWFQVMTHHDESSGVVIRLLVISLVVYGNRQVYIFLKKSLDFHYNSHPQWDIL